MDVGFNFISNCYISYNSFCLINLIYKYLIIEKWYNVSIII